MASDFADLHDDLRVVARDLLSAVPAGDAPDWNLLAASGWLGLEVPEALDGAGATFAEVAVILHEMGRAATRSPYLGSVVLGVGALDLLEPGTDRDALLRDIAAGEQLVAVALQAGDADSVSSAPPFRVDRRDGRVVLNGAASFVPDAMEADRLLLLALDDAVPVVVMVEPSTPGLERAPQPVLDETRRLAQIDATDVEVAESAVHRFGTDPADSVRRILDRAAVAIACDSLGLAEAMLEATVAYASVREQFDRPIGSFQAVKHMCADMLVLITVARELVDAAIEQVAADAPDAGTAASMAKSFATGAAVEVVGSALQVHGGIGYTWESGIHVHLKRAALDRALFGSPAAHRRALATRYLAE